MLLLILAHLAGADPTLDALLTLPAQSPEGVAARVEYLDAVEAQIDVPWRSTSQRLSTLRPVPAGDYRVVAQFSIDGEGALTEVRIAGSSGQQPVDHAALAAIRAAQPFPPPPVSLLVEGEFLVAAHELRYRSAPAVLPKNEPYPPGANPDEPSAFPGMAPEPTEKWPR